MRRARLGQALTFNTVIVTILVLVVFLVVSTFFVAKFSESARTIDSVSDDFTSDLRASMEFNVLDDSTEVIIEVEGDGPVSVEHHIPKEVIYELTYDNREYLIESERDYEILDPDPLIAWHVENPPSTINYTIKKRVSEKDLENFKVSVSKDSDFKLIRYGIYLFIILIVLFAIKPIFRDDNGKK